MDELTSRKKIQGITLSTITMHQHDAACCAVRDSFVIFSGVFEVRIAVEVELIRSRRLETACRAEISAHS